MIKKFLCPLIHAELFCETAIGAIPPVADKFVSHLPGNGVALPASLRAG
nr:MAG TPA: hypothetical protein [Caudoviricetes sp.]